MGFTDMSSRSSPLEVVAMLNRLYTEFDSLAARHKVFKVVRDVCLPSHMPVNSLRQGMESLRTHASVAPTSRAVRCPLMCKVRVAGRHNRGRVHGSGRGP